MIAASKDACETHDMLVAGMGVAQMVIDHVAEIGEDESVPREHWNRGISIINKLLKVMMRVRRKAAMFSHTGRQKTLLASYEEKIVQVRMTLSTVGDLQLSLQSREENQRIIDGVDYDTFVDHAKSNPPPQRWYEENHSGLRRD